VNDAWVSPDKAHVSVKDIGFLRGYGIFDFFRIMDGRAIFLSDHLDRFLSSAQKMGIKHRYSKAELSQLILDLAKTSNDSCLGVKYLSWGLFFCESHGGNAFNKPKIPSRNGGY